jgi:hypothetical protein
MKDRLVNALAAGDTTAIVDLTTRLGASAAAQSTSAGDEQESPALPYWQATAQRQQRRKAAQHGKESNRNKRFVQPTPHEYPMADAQVPAVITAWSEDRQRATLTIFPENQHYAVPKRDVAEGVDDGTFQQFGVLSRRAEDKKHLQEAQARAAQIAAAAQGR